MTDHTIADLLSSLRHLSRKGLQELACSIDPNGCWTDEAVYLEFGYRQTTEELRDAVYNMIDSQR
jgi:hypothetical protein